MKRDEVFFLTVLLAFFAIITANTVLDLGLIDSAYQSVQFNDSVKFTDIKPIFQQRCVQCHSNAQSNWTNYDVAYKNRDKIRFKVWVVKTMPIGGMPNEDRLKIRDWVDGGAKK